MLFPDDYSKFNDKYDVVKVKFENADTKARTLGKQLLEHPTFTKEQVFADLVKQDRILPGNNTPPVLLGLLPHEMDLFHIISYKIGISIEQCFNCAKSLNSDDLIRKLPCGHQLHNECFRFWTRNHIVCACCNEIIVPNP